MPKLPAKLDNVKLSPRQWAWEFLRRNKKYRAAWKAVVSLTAPQRIQLAQFDKAAEIQISQFDVASPTTDQRRLTLNSFPAYFFGLEDFNSELTLADWFKGPGAQRDGYDTVVAIDLELVCDFRLSTYCLVDWLDPDSPLSYEAAEGAWFLYMVSLFGLREIPTESAGSMKEHASKFAERHPEKVDRRKRRESAVASETLPLLKGADDSYFFGRSTEERQRLPLPLRTTEVAFVIRADVPIEIQFAVAEKVMRLQRRLLTDARVIKPIIAGRPDPVVLPVYVRILDLESSGMSHVQIACEMTGIAVSEGRDGDGKMVTLYETPDDCAPSTALVRTQIARAAALRDFGYVALAFSGFRRSD